MRPRFPFAVPGTDAVTAIDSVQADRQRVDDARGEVALGFELPGAQGDLRSEVQRELTGGEYGRRHLGGDDQHVVGHAFAMTQRNNRLEAAEGCRFMDEGQAQQRPAWNRFLMRSRRDPRGDRRRVTASLQRVFGAGNREKAGAVS